MRGGISRVVSVLLVIVLALGAYTVLMPDEALAVKPGGGGKCGQCPCVEEIEFPDGTVCWLEACHLLYPKDCLWDCHYVCPFPVP